MNIPVIDNEPNDIHSAMECLKSACEFHNVATVVVARSLEYPELLISPKIEMAGSPTNYLKKGVWISFTVTRNRVETIESILHMSKVFYCRIESTRHSKHLSFFNRYYRRIANSTIESIDADVESGNEIKKLITKLISDD